MSSIHSSDLLTATVTHDPTKQSSSPSTTPHPKQDDLSDLTPDAAPLPILIRATDGKASKPSAFHAAAAATASDHSAAGLEQHNSKATEKKQKKVKLSTIVQPDDLDTFYARYAEVCKTGMAAGLKKRDRKGRKEKRKKKMKGVAS